MMDQKASKTIKQLAAGGIYPNRVCGLDVMGLLYLNFIYYYSYIMDRTSSYYQKPFNIIFVEELLMYPIHLGFVKYYGSFIPNNNLILIFFFSQ